MKYSKTKCTMEYSINVLWSTQKRNVLWSTQKQIKEFQSKQNEGVNSQNFQSKQNERVNSQNVQNVLHKDIKNDSFKISSQTSRRLKPKSKRSLQTSRHEIHEKPKNKIISQISTWKAKEFQSVQRRYFKAIDIHLH